MNYKNIRKESGQIMVFVVLFIIGLFAMLALVLDGGNAYAKRRAAQNAADAGALAGARTLCMTKDQGQAEAVARDYATNRNEADFADVNIDGEGYVTVTTRITFATFFAHLIGRPEMTAEATATSGCFPPTSATVLPVAWACETTESGEFDCDEKIVTEEQLQFYLKYPTPADAPDAENIYHPGTEDPIWEELYIIMDGEKLPGNVEPICLSDGGVVNCDVSGDGIDDLVAGGDRSWLDLDGGGGGSSDLVNWVTGDERVEIHPPVWLDGQTGADTNVFHAVDDQLSLGKNYFVIPVFNALCTDYPPSDCPTLYPEDPILNTAVGKTYYHTVGFVYFYVTCVNAPSLENGCVGHDAAVDDGIIPSNTKTIEGYFVYGIPADVSGGDPDALDTGTYSLKLYK